ncbi:ATP-binding cassette domain-containing protein [Mycobacterium shigaense]|uniref:Putative ABC transporter, ATP-binding protein n=1 Tax=Mycobacterium shigaense TaxID=722731 RepID=A0A1Z4EKF0_9MYCO|nr:ATP-binding cassette domain-containing protein [Mycobacterium shigaense]PRI15933.1 ABC transporter [Mycobacterium shigaense]BAX93449.1 putative ABC transporter, ATP-binding protein [Mycobacterium shigaense]
MRNDAFASPLTVLVGPAQYVFPAGRDITVGHGRGWDVPLDGPGNTPAAPARPELLLRFTGTHWVAIDGGGHGVFLNGARLSTVDIRDGLAIAIGDPQRGPRLVFRVGTPAGPPPRPFVPPPPTQQPTQRLRIPAPRPPAAPPPTPPAPSTGPPSPPPLIPSLQTTPIGVAPPSRPAPVRADAEQTQGRGLIGRMTEATRRLRAGRSFRTGEAVATYRLPLEAGARTAGLAAYRLGLTADGRELLTDVSFTARLGSLTAITGPSAAHNAALLDVLTGTRQLSAGLITVDGHDVAAEPAAMRTRIGIVPREDRLHPQLTVERALRYTAELRLPPDTSTEHRQRVVEQILEELELAPHRATRICKLAPEVRRCAALAVELLSRPTLLVIDEPGAGLDAAQEDHVMTVLRRQADIGCVVVATMTSPTSLTHLNKCDQVVILTPRGTVAFAGPPLQVGAALATTDWSEVLARVAADPDGAQRAFRARQLAQGPPPPPAVAQPWPPPAEPVLTRQLWLVLRRQAYLLLAERLYLVFLVALPFVLAALTLLIPGDSGLKQPNTTTSNPHEAVEILAGLNIAAVIIGIALTVRDLVGERRAFERERAVGLSPSAYLAGKIIFCGVAAAILTAVTFCIVVVAKGKPAHGAVLLFDGAFELYVSVAVTAAVSAIVGLAISTMGKSLTGVVPLAAPVILASLLFAGGLITLVGTWGYDQISWFVPAQWGFAASASTVDLHRLDARAVNVQMWTHYVGWWVFDMVILVAFGAVWAGIARYRLRAHGTAAR